MSELTWVLPIGAIGPKVGATLALRASDGLSRWVWLVPMVIG